MNNRFMTAVMAVGLVMCGMGISIASQAGQQKLSVPAIGTEYTIGYLLKSIQKNSSNANFMVPTTDKAGKSPVALANTNAAVDIKAFMGSASARALALPALDPATKVTLRGLTAANLTYLKQLMPAKDQMLIDNYQKIAIYFVAIVNGKAVPFFIGEPCLPGLMTLNTTHKVDNSGANKKGLEALLRHWNFTSVLPAG